MSNLFGLIFIIILGVLECIFFKNDPFLIGFIKSAFISGLITLLLLQLVKITMKNKK